MQRLNVLFYNARQFDGYGRYATRLIQALGRAGVQVTPHFAGAADAPAWMLECWGVDFSAPTLSLLPPYYLRKLPPHSGPHWLLTMTEGSECPDGWAEIINKSGVERVIVPCQHNAEAFRNGGVEAPISVIPGGTDPDEFPYSAKAHDAAKPYTFLALADRGKRKGWSEVYDAFFKAFGTAEDVGPSKVRLVIKCRPGGNDLIDFILEKCPWIDPRLHFDTRDVADMREVYAQADCFVIPSRSEGWGMPHREAAMMGVPVITQAYSGMDDGHTHEWAIVVEKGHMEPIDATQDGHIKGQWRVVDRDQLARLMVAHYSHPVYYREFGLAASRWLRANQTWQHSARALLQLLHNTGVEKTQPVPEMEFA